MAYTPLNTGNPIGTWGSVDPRDLVDNAAILDRWVNDRTITQWRDRFGVQRLTWNGMEAEFSESQENRASQFQEFLVSSGYQVLGDYLEGISITDYNQLIRYEGEFYSLSPNTNPPYLITGVWATDSTHLVARGDAALRQQLGAQGGASLVKVSTGNTVDREITNLISLNVTTYEQRNSRPIELIAHRGFATQAPQNTAMAFSFALSCGADSLECDVAVSSDGVYYMFHDSTVDNLTTGTGTFTELSSSYLDSLELNFGVGTRISPVRISRFAEFLDIARIAGCFIYPEFKRYRSDSDLSGMIDMIEAARMDSACCIQSFSMDILAQARTINKNVEVGMLGSSTNTSYMMGMIDQLAELGKGVVLWEVSATLAMPEVVEYAFSKGVDWGVYVIDQRRYLVDIRKLGIRRIMSNCSIKV